MTRDDIVGVYRQLGADTVRADGTVVVDEPRSSQIMYTPDGYMAVVSTPVERPRLPDTAARTELNAVSVEQRAAAAEGVVCYAGRYEFKDADTLLHHVEMALNPNLVGQAVVRRAQLSGNDLTLSSVPDREGTYRRIRWRRASAV